MRTQYDSVVVMISGVVTKLYAHAFEVADERRARSKKDKDEQLSRRGYE
jgi:hypothetical protein